MKKVLIIEDDFYVRGLYKMALQKKNYTVIEAENGKIALEELKKQTVDLILLDLMLPEISGMEVLKQIKSAYNTPVYVLTNVGEEETIAEAVKQGATAYFLKVDYTPSQLVAAIEEKEKSRV